MATKEITFDGKNITLGGKQIPVSQAPKAAPAAKPSAGGSVSGDSWVPWVMGGGGALLAHALTSPMFEASEEEKRKESVWSKLLRTLIPLGVGGIGGIAGYALGNSLNKKAGASSVKKPAPAAAPAAPAPIKATLPHPVNVLKDSKGNPQWVLDGISQGDYDSWMGAHLNDDPKTLLDMQGSTMAGRSGVAHTVGTGLEYGGLAGGAVGGVMPWIRSGKMPSSTEINQINGMLEQMRGKMDLSRANLQKAQAAYAKAQRRVDTARMATAQKAIAKAKGQIKDVKSDMSVAKSKLPQGRAIRSLRNLGVGATVAGVGYGVDALGDHLGRVAMDYRNKAEKQQQINDAVQALINQWGSGSGK